MLSRADVPISRWSRYMARFNVFVQWSHTNIRARASPSSTAEAESPLDTVDWESVERYVANEDSSSPTVRRILTREHGHGLNKWAERIQWEGIHTQVKRSATTQASSFSRWIRHLRSTKSVLSYTLFDFEYHRRERHCQSGRSFAESRVV